MANLTNAETTLLEDLKQTHENALAVLQAIQHAIALMRARRTRRAQMEILVARAKATYEASPILWAADNWLRDEGESAGAFFDACYDAERSAEQEVARLEHEMARAQLRGQG